MNKIFFPFAAIIFFSSCELVHDYQAKSSAEDQARTEYRERLDEEFEQVLPKNHPRKLDFIDFVIDNSEIEATEIKDNKAVIINMKTISPQVRHLLLEILKPVEGRSVNAFNFGEALKLVRERHVSIPMTLEEKFSYYEGKALE